MEKYTDWFAGWEGTLITFTNRDSSWLLKRKLNDNVELHEAGEEDEGEQLWSNARAVFACINTGGSGPKQAVIKAQLHTF